MFEIRKTFFAMAIFAFAFASAMLAAPPSPTDHSAMAVATDVPANKHSHHNRHDRRALAENPRTAEHRLAPILEGLGHHHHPITTSSQQAQQFFDQGLKLTYGFNHQEALRSFKEVVRLDPDAAMAYWGWALVLGPNLNLPMASEVVPQAWEAIQLALEHKDAVSDRERGYIEALAERYSADPEADRASLDRAYAEAMGALHANYPEDLDAATLYAAALMNTMPWNYWTRDGRPSGDSTLTARAVLEKVMQRDPHHEGALHYYIHLVESVDPERGVEAADRLRGLAPGAGHLTHMPSHIYMQTGRYAEAYEANAQAAQADEGYITQCRAQGIYPLNYYPHNVHFLVWSAIYQGRADAALEAARKVAAGVPGDLHGNDWALYQPFLSMPIQTLARFGRWDEVLAEPRPEPELRFWRGIWHYARGLAFNHTARAQEAAAELDALNRLVEDPATSEMLIGFSDAATLLTIAQDVLTGEILAQTERFDEAIAHLDRAARLEESLLYTEPSDWFIPVRHTLGAVLLEAGRAREAEVVYWQDLRQHPDNGWALYGLVQSLESQRKLDQAAKVHSRFRTAWKDADGKLSSSRF